ncbi:MAG: acetolactate decarboxylase [Chloroflexi bacterium]|nr:acetolactate decarboxylase [Chloroflexota bacterium]
MSMPAHARPFSSTPFGKNVRQKSLLIVFLGLFTLAGCVPPPVTIAPSAKNDSAITQVSIYSGFQTGLYDGDVTYAQLAQMGNFGLGTFNSLDGEMVALDGKFYQAKIDGSVQVVDPQMKTPFADVHFFHSQQQVQLNESLQNYDQLKAYLTKQLPSANRPYAFKITATFPTLKIRSVGKQNQPYPLLQDAVAQQTVFELQNITGTLVGYSMPDYLSGVSPTGYHFHFISADQQHAGHMLDCSLNAAMIEIDYLETVTLLIPQNAPFQEANFVPLPK